MYAIRSYYDNDIRFYLGLALEYQNKQHEAEHQYKLAELGTDEPAGMMYYNDQPADMIYYQGLAFQKEKNTKKANARFYRLIDFGERHLTDEVNRITSYNVCYTKLLRSIFHSCCFCVHKFHRLRFH